MYGKNIPLQFWGLAVQCAAYIHNRTTHSARSITPYEYWYKKKPDVPHLKVFGCRAFVHVPDEKRRKLDPKATEGVMMGYLEKSLSCYKIWDPAAKKLVISRDVIFEEEAVMRLEGSDDVKEEDYFSIFPTHGDSASKTVVERPDELVPGNQVEEGERRAANHPEDGREINPQIDQDVYAQEDDRQQPDQLADQPREDDDDGFPEDFFHGWEEPPAVQLRRSQRTSKPTAEYREFRGYKSDLQTTSDKSETNRTTCLSTKIFGKQDLTFQEALSSKEGELWKAAMDDEYASLMKNNTWKLVPLPPGRVPIKCRWVFDIKAGYEGVPERYKARLVALGCSQKPGVDFNQTFAPVVKLSTLRLILALVAAHDLEVLQVDVKTAFLNGQLDEEIYMRQPEGYVAQEHEREVCRLTKSLYGLKQAPRAWNIELNDAIIKFGLVRSEEDQCVYHRIQGREWILVIFFVDDGLICGTSKKIIEEFVDHLKKRFEIRILPAERFLGITIDRDRSKKRLSISQPESIEAMLNKFKMGDCKSFATPAEPGLKLSLDMSPKTDKERDEMRLIPYKEAVGALLYISTTTRPDISYAVGQVAKFNHNPGLTHWRAVKRIFRYLAGTRKHGIFFSPKEDQGVVGFTDADHAGDLDDRGSTSGCVFLCHGGSISWFSRKQNCTSLSTTEAEFVAGGEAAKEATWIRAFLREIQMRGSEAIPLFCDNQGAIRVANNPELHRKMKHVELRLRFVQQAQKTRIIDARYVDSQNQVADIFTKALPTPSFQYLRQKLGVTDAWIDEANK